jgi:hypothetical protein
MSSGLTAPLESPCPYPEACSFYGRCIKNTDEFSKKYPVSWASFQQRAGGRAGVGTNFTPDGWSNKIASSGFGFAPPQFSPTLFKEGEWISSGSSVVT